MPASVPIEPTIVRLERTSRPAWARHRSRARRTLRRLLVSWCLTGRWHYPVLLLSRTGYLLAREKYSAFAIDRVYANAPEGWGWIGRRLDRFVLDLPVHRAARARLDVVVRHGVEILDRLLAERTGRLAVLSLPCGLARDLGAIHAALRLRRPDAGDRLVLYGLDLDHEGRVLDEARRRAARAGVPVRLVQANALRERAWSWLARTEAPLLLVTCIGLAPWLSPAELRHLLARFAEHLQPGGYLLIDRWNRGRHAGWGRAAEIHAHYHSHDEYRALVGAAGYVLLRTEVLGEDEGMVYLLQRSSSRPAARASATSGPRAGGAQGGRAGPGGGAEG